MADDKILGIFQGFGILKILCHLEKKECQILCQKMLKERPLQIFI